MKNLFLSNNVLSYLLYIELSKECNVEICLTSDPKSKDVTNKISNKLYGSKIKVIFYLFRIIIFSIFKKYDTVFIGYPNLVSVILIKFTRYNRLCYIDDGTTFYEIIDDKETLYSNMMKDKKIKTMLYKIFGINADSLILTKFKKLNRLIVFLPEIYRESMDFSKYIIDDAMNYIPNTKEVEKLWDLSVIINSDINNIILSQPFKELNIKHFGDEVNHVKNLINKYPNEKFSIKPHPREDPNKYSSIKGVIILDPHIPAELILLSQRYNKIYGYYSASMFNVATKQVDSEIISLLDRDTSEQSRVYFEKVKLLRKYIKRLNFEEEKGESISSLSHI